jgi:hypothetical protein
MKAPSTRLLAASASRAEAEMYAFRRACRGQRSLDREETEYKGGEVAGQRTSAPARGRGAGLTT